jgi:3-hydroxyisobutyrate dehydrogenase-like beta-hydroxyacid dehydrogenase
MNFYLKKDGLFECVTHKHYVIDMCIEDLTTSNKLHAIALSKEIRYYDCQIFPVPTTLISFERNQPSAFLGGNYGPSEFVYHILYSLARSVFNGKSNQGIIYKMVVSVFFCRFFLNIAIYDDSTASTKGSIFYG